MKNIFLVAIAFLIGLGAVLGYQYLKARQTALIVEPRPEADQPMAGTFALVPPSEALSGVLTVTSGHAEKLSREDAEYKEASSGAQILLGESIATKTNSTAVTTVHGFVTATMGPVSELVFANLFPKNFVLQQKSGKIEYQVNQPISVRALHALVNINPADVTINIIDTDMSVTVKTGSVKFALVDTDNNTKVWELKAGERANIDDAAREVFLIQAR